MRDGHENAGGTKHGLLEVPALVTSRSGALNLGQALASPRLTVAFFFLMAAGGLWVAQGGGNATWTVLLPLTLLVVNLAAAIATKPRFRADLPLLLFHLALLALVVLFGLARLVYFDGAVMLTAGTAFDSSTLARDLRGPLHGDGVRALRFANEGFTENFPERSKYRETYNRVRWWDESGASQIAEIGDDRPLVLDGYRIYASSRRGFSPIFHWQPANGPESLGSVELPDRDQAEMGPASKLHLPGGMEAWVLLLADAPTIAPGGQLVDRGSDDVAHHLVLRIGEQRHELRQGQSVQLDGGRLSYVRLSSWMGYRIVYDPTEPWLAATVVVAIASLLWFYARLLRKSGGRPELEGG